MPLSQLLADLDSVISDLCSEAPTPGHSWVNLRHAVTRRNEIQRQLSSVEQKLSVALSLVEHDSGGQTGSATAERVSRKRFVIPDRCHTGIEQLDEGHRLLIAMANQLLAFAYEEDVHPETLLSDFSAFINHVQQYFSTEANLLAASRYPALEKHRQAHTRMIDYLVEARQLAQIAPLLVSIKVEYFLGRMFMSHMEHEDMAFAKHYLHSTEELAAV